MTENITVRARVNEKIKKEASDVLEDAGLTISDAIRILLTRIAKDKSFPLELIPNALTADTIRKGRKGEGIHTAKNKEDLFKQLGL